MTSTQINTNETAQEIFNQLGGMKFAMITGSRSFIIEGHTLTFKLARNKSKASHVRIIYHSGSDLYEVQFLKFTTKTLSFEPVQTFDNIYADQLTNIFTSITGLYTSL